MATQTKTVATRKRSKAAAPAVGQPTTRRPAAPAKKSAAPAKPKTPKPLKAVKPAAPLEHVPAAAAEAKADKASKLKLVRDSFTMPRSDVALIDTLKSRAVNFKRPAKKSELLRAGLHALATMGDQQLKAALDALEPLRPGRPKKSD